MTTIVYKLGGLLDFFASKTLPLGIGQFGVAIPKRPGEGIVVVSTKNSPILNYSPVRVLSTFLDPALYLRHFGFTWNPGDVGLSLHLVTRITNSLMVF